MLQEMRTHQRERLQQQRLHQGERESSSQFMNQPSVQAKMRTFLAHFATLTSPTCATCLESFPDFRFIRHLLNTHVVAKINIHRSFLFRQ